GERAVLSVAECMAGLGDGKSPGDFGGIYPCSAGFDDLGVWKVSILWGGIGMELNMDRITKQYGAKIAVDRISLTLKPGVTGLLGANGAGKTTLMRMICGI